MTKILEEVNFVFKKCIFLSTLLMLTAFHLLISRHNLALYQIGPNIENFFFSTSYRTSHLFDCSTSDFEL
jgi:hypothetical protein